MAATRQSGIVSRIDTGSGTADSGLVAPSSAGQYRVEAVPTTGGTLDGLTFFGGLSWQRREVDAHEPGSSPQALKLLLSQYSIYSWLGTATGEVVDIGTGADTDPAAMDLKGRIVLWTPATSDTSFNNELYQELTDAGTAAIMYVGYGLSVYRPTPVLRLDPAGAPVLRDRLAQGPLTLTLNGVGTGADAYYLHHSVDGRVPAGADWMSAPFNPALGRTAGTAQVVRDGDKLKVALPVFSDAAGHRAETAPGADSGITVLADDGGKVLARNAAPGRATFDLPREKGWYRLTADATRTSPDPVTWMLGTRVTSEWRLRSGHEKPAAPARLLDLDYRLPLTGENAADPESRSTTRSVSPRRGTGRRCPSPR
ncbi:hypothetical protein [Streptomyces sp. NBC_01363]|uniref:hypothetical protein n=1 Tax=Streptomyces sp. NBC_01363 TaxID=2903840 RepID=UPI00225B7A8D|nr:hypothetical protein [Streptomyces sp. NBC_01363]MCX4736145.1 hypothetical protein [Streptomyces sp. NBC_01363]